MDLQVIILLCFIYFFGCSTSWTFGTGYYTLYRPVIAGGLAGLVLGDTAAGFFIGALVNTLYLDFSSTGGSLKGDGCLMSIMAVCIAYMLKINHIQALALSWPFSIFGALLWKYRLRINIHFVNRYKNKLENKSNIKCSIFLYNAIFPQLLLLFSCSFIILISILTLYLVSNIANNNYIGYILKICGFILIFSCLIKRIVRINNVKKAVLFILFFTLSLLNIYISLAICVVIVFICILYDYIYINKYKAVTESKLNKADLFCCWSRWMNFCHACYNFEVMQGLGFTHSMKNIIYRLYKSTEKRNERLLYYIDYFNVEPNIGTPILGYTVAMEEKYSSDSLENGATNENSDINDMRKAMMGIVSGMGDSFTQTVITPIFISLCVAFALTGSFIPIIVLVAVLAIVIIYISYSGFIKGYMLGKDGLLKVAGDIKKSIFKKYNLWFQIALDAVILAGVVMYIPIYTYDISIIVISVIASVLLHIFCV